MEKKRIINRLSIQAVLALVLLFFSVFAMNTVLLGVIFVAAADFLYILLTKVHVCKKEEWRTSAVSKAVILVVLALAVIFGILNYANVF